MPVLSCAQCQTANDAKRLRCNQCQALLSRLSVGQIFQGRFRPVELLETDTSVLTYTIQMDEDGVPAVLREYFPLEAITRERLMSLDRVAGALLEGMRWGFHPLTEYFAVEGCFYTIEEPLPKLRLSSQLLYGPLTPEAGGRLLAQLTHLILKLPSCDPPLYHGALSPFAIGFAAADGPPVLVSPRVLAEVLDSGELPGPRDALNRDLPAAALSVLHAVSGQKLQELATDIQVRRSVIDSKFTLSPDGPVLDWLGGGGPVPESAQTLLAFEAATARGCASMAQRHFVDAEGAWQTALRLYRCPMVESWIGAARDEQKKAAAAIPPPASPSQNTGDWRCRYCGCLNFPDSVFCGKCGTKRGEQSPRNRPAVAPAPQPVMPALAPPPAASVPLAKDLGWRCLYCEFLNLHDSVFCAKCGTKWGEQKPRSRPAFAPASEPLIPVVSPKPAAVPLLLPPSSQPVSKPQRSRGWLALALAAGLAAGGLGTWYLIQPDLGSFVTVLNSGALVSPVGNSAYDRYLHERQTHGVNSRAAEKMRQLAKAKIEASSEAAFSSWRNEARLSGTNWTAVARVEQWRRDVDSSATQAGEQFALGQAAFDARNYQEAHNRLQGALHFRPEWDLALTALGRAYLRQRRYKEAEKYYLEAVSHSNWIYPRLYLAELYIGQTKGKVNRYAEAERQIRVAVNTAPKRAEPREILGRLLFLERRYADACDELQHAVKLSETMARPPFELAAVLQRKEQACRNAAQ